MMVGMKSVQLTTIDVDRRVRDAIFESMVIYSNKLSYGNLSIGLEATFQHYLALILKGVLEQKTLTNSERFSLTLEQNVPLNGRNNYVDIVIHHDDTNGRRDYLVELKYKKQKDGAQVLGVVETYFDLYNLDLLHHKSNPGNIFNCYVIFLTDLQTYKNPPKSGTRVELPMYDNAVIQKNAVYMPSNNTSKNLITEQYGSSFKGFEFAEDLSFEYNAFQVDGKDYWYFIQEL